jgi:hypothetical protein
MQLVPLHIGDDAAVETMPTPSPDESFIVEARATIKVGLYSR